MASSDNLSFKHRKIENEEDADLLNAVLPEEVVSHILSLLPTKEAIKTSILSKRWRNLWTAISSLDFHDNINRDFEDNKEQRRLSRKKFITYVSSVLLRLDPTKSIDKFSITLDKHRKVLQIKEWISCAVERNVKDLTLSLLCYNIYNQIDVPHKVFDCKSLEALRLYAGLHLKIPKQGFVSFPNLKSLSLGFVSISGIPDKENFPCFPKLVALRLVGVIYAGKDDSLMKLIRNCPLLKDLSINRLLGHDVTNDDMCIPQLTNVHLDCRCNVEYLCNVGVNVQIEAPIKYLKISFWNPTHKITVKNPDSLIRAELSSDELSSDTDERHHFPREQQGEVLKLIETVDKVKSLTLSIDVTAAIKFSTIKLPSFVNLIHLDVSVNCVDLCMLESYLNSANSLQSLVINKKFRPCVRGEDGHCVGDNGRWTEFTHVPKCMISSLKTVEIMNARDCPGELDMIKIILKFAKVLEEFTTSPHCMNRRDTDSLCRKLSTFPRASALCQFHFPPYTRIIS